MFSIIGGIARSMISSGTNRIYLPTPLRPSSSVLLASLLTTSPLPTPPQVKCPGEMLSSTCWGNFWKFPKRFFFLKVPGTMCSKFYATLLNISLISRSKWHCCRTFHSFTLTVEILTGTSEQNSSFIYYVQDPQQLWNKAISVKNLLHILTVSEFENFGRSLQ